MNEEKRKHGGGEQARGVAGLVVLYNPTVDVIRNVESYRAQVDILFALDNSEAPDEERAAAFSRLANVHYAWNGGNGGLAAALNAGARLAGRHRCEFLLMMDQDSVASSNLVAEFRSYLAAHRDGTTGLLAPYHEFRNYARPADTRKVREIDMTITSGTMLSLAAYAVAGPFMDDLFIDYVDFEYCLRLRSHGFRIVQLSDAKLDHPLGRTVARKFLFRRVAVYNHDPVRVYYRFRNRLRVARLYFFRYPRWAAGEICLVVNELIKILCFEDRKTAKIAMALRGIVDFFRRKTGMYTAGS